MNSVLLLLLSSLMHVHSEDTRKMHSSEQKHVDAC